MPTALPEGYKLDDDPGRIDVDAVHRFVTEAYWAKGRSRDVVAAAIKGSERRRCRWLLQPQARRRSPQDCPESGIRVL